MENCSEKLMSESIPTRCTIFERVEAEINAAENIWKELEQKYQQQNKTVEHKLETLRTQDQQNQFKIKLLKNQLTEMTEKMEKTQQETSSKQNSGEKEIEALKAKLQEQTKQNTRYKNCASKFKDAIKELKARHEANLKIKNDENESLRREIIRLERENGEVSSEQLKEKNIILESEIKSVRLERSESNNKIKKLELEIENNAKELEISEKRYQNLLVLPFGRDELLKENEHLKKQIDKIDKYFDETWAGFRVEVFRYEKMLQEMQDELETLKAEREGKSYERSMPNYEDT